MGAGNNLGMTKKAVWCENKVIKDSTPGSWHKKIFKGEIRKKKSNGA